MSILGVILAGGQARRMGGIDKGRLKIGDASILEITTKTLSFQLDKIVLNANGDLRRFSDLEIQVIPDTIKDMLAHWREFCQVCVLLKKRFHFNSDSCF